MKWLETISGQVIGQCADPALVTQESPWRAPTSLDRESPPSGGCRCSARSSESGPGPPPVLKNIAAADDNSQGGNSRESPGKEDSTGEAASALPVRTNTSQRVLSGFLKTPGNSFPPPYFSVSFWGLYQTPEISKDYVLASHRRAGINVRLAAAQSLKPSPGLWLSHPDPSAAHGRQWPSATQVCIWTPHFWCLCKRLTYSEAPTEVSSHDCLIPPWGRKNRALSPDLRKESCAWEKPASPSALLTMAWPLPATDPQWRWGSGHVGGVATAHQGPNTI